MQRLYESPQVQENLRMQVRAIFGKTRLPAPNLPPRLSNYEILRELGAGSRGTVYLARDCRLNRLVAVKTLRPSSNDEANVRFLREATLAATLNDPQIVMVYELVRDHDTDWMVMEYVQGKTLDQVIAQRGLPLRTCLDYARQMARALVAIHSARMVHRDLKPSNFIVTANGVVKLLDFGLAKSLRGPANSLFHRQTILPETLDGTILGTPGYMSPEQVRGHRADRRSDLFSFGAIFYEMLAGRRAFCQATLVETMSAILRKTPKKLPTRIPPNIVNIVDRCLAKDPEQRYKNAIEMALDLGVLNLRSRWRSRTIA